MTARIGVAGAGIYGATAAIRLASRGHKVELFDPLGIMQAASAINQYRVHAGYHYPRSAETIDEVLAERSEFIEAFKGAIVDNSRHYYAVPRTGSLTSAEAYEQIMREHGLALRRRHPNWIDFEFVDRCYEVDENVYDPDKLRDILTERIREAKVSFRKERFCDEHRADFDFVVWATYGVSENARLFDRSKLQVAEKVLIKLPPALRHVALVLVDGPFTAFDPYGASDYSLFGSAKHTNHWSTQNGESIPARLQEHLNKPAFLPVSFSAFSAMKSDCTRAVPAVRDAVYCGSRFTVRMVEDNPAHDRRTLYLKEGNAGEFHIFSGKVVGAVKAARLVCEMIDARVQ